MSHPSDYAYEMSDQVLADETLEALFQGLPHPEWEQDLALAALATDVGAAIAAPAPLADHALLQLFWAAEPATVAPAGAASVKTKRTAGVGPGTPVLTRRRWRRLLAAVAAGMAAATLGIGAVGAVGVLPAPAQRIVARVAEAVSPFEIPEPKGMEKAPDASSGGGDANISEGSGTQAPAGQTATTTPSRTVAPTAPSGESGTAPTAPGGAPGAAGLGRAAQTPAGASVPPTLPEPAAAGHGPATAANTSAAGDRARETPAGTVVPPSPPVPPRAGPPARP